MNSSSCYRHVQLDGQHALGPSACACIAEAVLIHGMGNAGPSLSGANGKHISEDDHHLFLDDDDDDDDDNDDDPGEEEDDDDGADVDDEDVDLDQLEASIAAQAKVS